MPEGYKELVCGPAFAPALCLKQVGAIWIMASPGLRLETDVQRAARTERCLLC